MCVYVCVCVCMCVYMPCVCVCVYIVERQTKVVLEQYFDKFGKFSSESDLHKIEKLF